MNFGVKVAMRATIKDIPDLPPTERKRLLDAHLDEVMEELLDLEGVLDPDISVTFSTGDIDFSLIVEAASPDEAVEKGNSLVRRAIAAAGGLIEDWWRTDWGKATATQTPQLV